MQQRLDKGLIFQKLKNREIEAWFYLYRLQKKHLRRIAYNLTDDHNQAKIIVKAAFLRLWAEMDRFTSLKEITDFLNVHTSEISFEYIIKKKETGEIRHESCCDSTDNPNPEEIIIKEERDAAVVKEMENLKTNKRLFEFFYDNSHFSFNEIAGLFGRRKDKIIEELSQGWQDIEAALISRGH